HLRIQFIGTPPNRDFLARAYSSADFGCSATNLRASRAPSSFNLSLLIAVMFPQWWGTIDGARVRFSRSSQLVNNFSRRIGATRARQSIARMRSAAAHK